MASKDANDTRRGNRPVTDLQQRRLDVRAAGGKPKCGSPLVNSKDPDSPNHGKTCGRPAGAGTDHAGYGNCSQHAGMMKPSKVSAAREQVAHEVAKFRRFYGERVQGISFEEALLEEMQRSVGVVRWLEERIALWGMDWDGQNEDGSVRWKPGETNLPPFMTEHQGFRSIAVADSEFAAVLRHYLLERRHLADISKAGVQSGIAKSMVELHQRQSEMLYAILFAAIKVLAPDRIDEVPLILPSIIREITGKAS